MTNAEKSAHLAYVTKVTGLDRWMVDSLVMYGVTSLDVGGDVHTWQFPGTVPEAIQALSNARLKLDKKADAAVVAAIDHVWTILFDAGHVLGGRDGRYAAVEVVRIADDNPPLARHDVRLADLEQHRRRVEQLDQEKFGLIHRARVDGCSWAEIGKALGMTKQSAQDWYARRVD